MYVLYLFIIIYLVILWWRAPQQMLRRHRSLEAYCVTLWSRWLVFFVLPCNETPVEWNWQGKIEVFGGGGNLSQCHVYHHKSHMDWVRIEPEPQRWIVFISFRIGWELNPVGTVTRLWAGQPSLRRWIPGRILKFLSFSEMSRIDHVLT
jgi:hypothetical protein